MCSCSKATRKFSTKPRQVFAQANLYVIFYIYNLILLFFLCLASLSVSWWWLHYQGVALPVHNRCFTSHPRSPVRSQSPQGALLHQESGTNRRVKWHGPLAERSHPQRMLPSPYSPQRSHHLLKIINTNCTAKCSSSTPWERDKFLNCSCFSLVSGPRHPSRGWVGTSRRGGNIFNAPPKGTYWAWSLRSWSWSAPCLKEQLPKPGTGRGSPLTALEWGQPSAYHHLIHFCWSWFDDAPARADVSITVSRAHWATLVRCSLHLFMLILAPQPLTPVSLAQPLHGAGLRAGMMEGQVSHWEHSCVVSCLMFWVAAACKQPSGRTQLMDKSLSVLPLSGNSSWVEVSILQIKVSKPSVSPLTGNLPARSLLPFPAFSCQHQYFWFLQITMIITSSHIHSTK